MIEENKEFIEGVEILSPSSNLTKIKIRSYAQVKEIFVSTNNSKPSYIHDELVTSAHCTIKMRYICEYCGKVNGWVNKSLDLEFKKRSSGFTQEQIQIRKTQAEEELRSAIKEMLKVDEKGAGNYDLLEKGDASCISCGHVQTWWQKNNSKKDLIMGICLIVVMGIIGLILYLYNKDDDLYMAPLFIGIFAAFVNVIIWIKYYFNSLQVKQYFRIIGENYFPKFGI